MTHDVRVPLPDTRYLDCLAADFDRLRSVATAADTTAVVPSCPDWTVADLVRHVGQVYVDKTHAMREGTESEWPPKGTADAEPFDLLDRAYADLRGELTTRAPGDPAGGWYKPDRSVGFWIRRMAQETVIHRIDAELAAGEPIAPVPEDLAIDGIDELLKVFTAYGVTEWAEYFADALAASPGRTYEIRALGTKAAAWRIRTGPGQFTVEDGTGDGTAADTVLTGSPQALLLDLWNRRSAGDPSGVTVTGAPEAVAELRACLATATQ
ncbi:maleylpyruvate isomerase N-terminal domain-containing protein [Streptomyces sp. VRA16 Mangrove soil]|uniref:maleylpyruvate isomerase N-terminal domain-containing protein n=1 Tax=Streptomyces sp. VRA16 Mangrove soil TaxID=2817434 RepID=UPI001A9FD492|nr:maleylpyruvate isomerase N-terminal domain-containing protein [Streptomyces sp. VRA16 Mangrove soil]MBO1336467.1 maleylpyruvate isomerase family mycothiol-dependent enzyme [Streptomyces sp. VRA16 Mangrove soil]